LGKIFKAVQRYAKRRKEGKRKRVIVRNNFGLFIRVTSAQECDARDDDCSNATD